jgi:rhodanese-related sulfurtransferase
LAASVLAIAGAARAEPSWPELLERIRREFPTVPQLGVRALHATLGPRTLLVDVREPAEFAVSRLPGARRTQRVDDVRAWLASGAYDRVVVYCSVGYRSSKFVRQLQRAGIAAGANLEGGGFAWANAGHPLENDAGATTQVHPFDASWGALLAPERRASLR